MCRLVPALAFVLLAAGAAARADEAPQERPRRTLVIELGQADLVVDVNGETWAADEQGALTLTLASTAEETVRIRSRDPAWLLDVTRPLPADDPAIPVHIDLTSEVRPAPPPPPPAPPPPPPPPVDPCLDRPSLRCRQIRWSALEDAVGRRDCAAARTAIERIRSEYPDFLASGEVVTTLMQVLVDCAPENGGADAVREAVALADDYGDAELWCDAASSRVLARAFESLSELADAARRAAAARGLCPEEPAALEWEFYFRFRLGESARSAELAAAAPGRLGTFLRVWLELGRGECITTVELEDSGDLPCRGLPQEFCSRQYGRHLLACSREGEDYKAAARYLRAALPSDPGAWDALAAGPGRDVLAELAEAEYLSGDFTAAARLYERLLRFEATDHGTLWRLFGDALLLADTDDATRRAARDAYQRAIAVLPADSVAATVVMNNICVVRARLGETMESSEMTRDLKTLEAALEELPPAEEQLRLWLTHSFLSLSIRLVEDAAGLDPQEKLARLEELRGPFAEFESRLSGSTLGGSSHVPPRDAAPPLEMIEYDGRRFTVALP